MNDAVFTRAATAEAMAVLDNAILPRGAAATQPRGQPGEAVPKAAA
ncbi:MAG: hypothetical protein AMXMBFR47_04200 [Planctomycetota bacterium]